MRLSSVREFESLLEGLQTFGFVVPFKNYQQDLIDAGLVEHIHLYECKINITYDRVGISFSGKNIVKTYFFNKEEKI